MPSVDELIDGLPYVNAVFKETLRLYPIGVFVARELQENCNVMGYDLVKGTPLHVRFCTPSSPAPLGIRQRGGISEFRHTPINGIPHFGAGPVPFCPHHSKQKKKMT